MLCGTVCAEINPHEQIGGGGWGPQVLQSSWACIRKLTKGVSAEI